MKAGDLVRIQGYGDGYDGKVGIVQRVAVNLVIVCFEQGNSEYGFPKQYVKLLDREVELEINTTLEREATC